jgi:voltage-gated potassium channel Kch
MNRSKLYPAPSLFFNIKVFLRGMSVPIMIFGLLVLSSTIVFSTLEGKGFLDSIYFTVVTITTVGYGDVKPETPEGKIATMILLVIGILSLSFASRYLIDYVVKARDKNFIDSLIINKLDNHIIIVGYNPILVTTAKLLETLNIPVIFLVSETSKIDVNSEFIIVETDSLILDSVRQMNLEKSKGLIIDSSEDDGMVITLLTLREEYKNLIITVLTDDEDLQTLFTSAKNVDFIYKPFLLGYTIKNELLGLKILGEYRIRLENNFEMQEIPISTIDLEKEIVNIEIKGIHVIGFISHAFNELTLRKNIRQNKSIFDGIIVSNTKKEELATEGKLLVFGEKSKLQEIVSSHSSRKKLYENVLVMADENLDGVDLIIPSLKSVSKNIQFFIPESDNYIKGLSKIKALSLPIRTGSFSTEYKDSELKKFDLVIIMLQSPTKSLGVIFHLRRVSQLVKIWVNNSDPKAYSLFHNSGADFVFATDDSLALGTIDPYVNTNTYSNAVLVVPEIQSHLLSLVGPSLRSILKKYKKTKAKAKAQVLLLWDESGKVTSKMSKRKRLGKSEKVLVLLDRFT